MLRELVSKNIFVFTSELYAQVTAGGILTPAGAIVIDTLAFPVETQQMIQFLEQRHETPVRYVVNTHYHADHTYGTCFFEDATVVSHRMTRDALNGPGREALKTVKRNSREMRSVALHLPDIVFDEDIMRIHLDGITLQLWRTPGHSPDSCVCLVEEEGILFAADTMMPIPFFADGSWHDYVNSLESLKGRKFDTIVQGHGEVILRGEVESRIDEDLAYLYSLRESVETILDANLGPESLNGIDIEECGKSRIALNGLVQQLHRSNAEVLYWSLYQEREGTQV